MSFWPQTTAQNAAGSGERHFISQLGQSDNVRRDPAGLVTAALPTDQG
jgi:hypothetical protein